MKLTKLLLILFLLCFGIWAQVECIGFGYDGAIFGPSVYCIRSTKFETHTLYLIDSLLKLKGYEERYIPPLPPVESIEEKQVTIVSSS
jgi:hypothetical protein